MANTLSNVQLFNGLVHTISLESVRLLVCFHCSQVYEKLLHYGKGQQENTTQNSLFRKWEEKKKEKPELASNEKKN